MKAQHFYDFGPYSLDAVERVLLRAGRPVPLQPKDLETLLVLLENRGHIVEKEELMRRVWPGVYVEEGNLARRISNLRNQLEERSNGQKCIETVPKRGYRFVSPVTELGESASLVHAPPESVAAGLPPVGADSRSRRPLSLLLALAALSLAALGLLAYRSGRRHAAPVARKIMLAVLPVENMTGRGEYEYIADGLTDEIIAQLGGMQPEQMGIIARTSSMTYKGTRKRVDEIGRELGVDYVLESSFRGTPQHIRVISQLIRVRDQTHLWSQNYDRDLSEIVQLEQEIAASIAGTVELRLAPPASARPEASRPLSPEAYLLYLKGRQAWNTRSGEGLRRSLTYFRQAVEKDPTFARAYAGEADALNILLFYGYVSGKDAIGEATSAAERAIQLDESLPDGHAALGYAMFMWSWDWQRADEEFQKALAADSNYAPAHHWYAMFLAAMGRREESIAQIREAQNLDPLSSIVNTAAGYVYYFARNFDRAAAECQRVLVRNPNFTVAHLVLGMIHEARGNSKLALKEYQIVLSLRGSSAVTSFFRAQIGRAEALSGNVAEARRMLQELGEPEYGLAQVALIYAALGEKERAVTYLEKALARDDESLVWLKVDPLYDRLRSEPRFAALLDKRALRK